MPFPAQSFDVAYSMGVLHHTPDILRAFREAQRVLRPGGEFWVILYHKHSVFYWLSLFLTEYLLFGQFRRMTFRERLSRIEYTSSNQLPLVNVYTKREVKQLLLASGFTPVSLCVRKLTREDLPQIPVIRNVWSVLPQKWLDSMGHLWGWYVVACARKPME